MPLLERNIGLNAHLFSGTSTRPQAVVLDWDDEQLPVEMTEVEFGLDLIVCLQAWALTPMTTNSICRGHLDTVRYADR